MQTTEGTENTEREKRLIHEETRINTKKAKRGPEDVVDSTV
jgi:hypothetical protein